MMVFITRYFANVAKWLSVAAVLLLCLTSPLSRANGIEPQKAVAVFTDSHIELSARFSVKLNPTLEQALQNGLTLPFQFEFQLNRPRLYAWAHQLSDWFGPNAILTQRLSYQPLTRQYRVSSGGFSRNFTSLNEALSALGIVSSWRVLPDSDIIQNSKEFAGKLRLRLDLSQLPKPYQMTAIGQNDWHVDSPWADLAVQTEAEANQQ